MRRARELHWMLKHIRDIESDFSAIHGIDDIWSMNGPRFFAFAYRLPAYKGVMRALAENEASQQQKKTGGRDLVSVGSGELSKINGLGDMISEGLVTVEKAT